ncbi:MAG: hypothetical protein VYA20_02430 [Candidatus Neomarinimicrobiota bacterium]|nr:hypothetical protein [Candidatus Neomarinimicrobiota bacterium]
MDDLQKKFAIVGLTAFIVWFLLGIGKKAFYQDTLGEFVKYGIFYTDHTLTHTAQWPSFISFSLWLGCLIAFFVYRD